MLLSGANDCLAITPFADIVHDGAVGPRGWNGLSARKTPQGSGATRPEREAVGKPRSFRRSSSNVWKPRSSRGRYGVIASRLRDPASWYVCCKGLS